MKRLQALTMPKVALASRSAKLARGVLRNVTLTFSVGRAQLCGHRSDSVTTMAGGCVVGSTPSHQHGAMMFHGACRASQVWRAAFPVCAAILTAAADRATLHN